MEYGQASTTVLSADPKSLGEPRISGAGKVELVCPNGWVQSAFYFSLLAIPFFQLYLPGTGERLGVKRVIQGLMLAAIVSRPRVCLRLLPVALCWLFAYCCLRIIFGLWLAPQYWALWWPNSLELLQFLLPWTWLLFNVLHYPRFREGGLWAFVAGVSLCAALHIVGIGVTEVDNGAEGRSTVFEQNANEIGETYGVALVALVALGLFRETKQALRVLVFPLALLTAIALAKTGSRTGALLSTVGIVVLLPQTRAFLPRIKRYVILLLVALVFAGAMYQIPTVLKRFSSVASSDVTQEEARARMVPVLWEIFLRSPVYGSGPEQYQFELTRRAMPYLADKQQLISAHNLPLFLLAEMGVIGFLIFAVGLGKALAAAWHSRLGSCGLLPLAWLLPMTIAGLTISCPVFSPLLWLAIAYALACADPIRRQVGFRLGVQ
ncbi:MAG TPA: O-antigen ligase family protein [Candidatus Limnocylindrales bacterium]|nr:O-antigen ligase family protein [Candidatus Limnocylindrales bacterium]